MNENVILKANYTDDGAAHRLNFLHGDKISYVRKWGKWFLWDEVRWKADEMGEIENIARDTAQRILEERRQLPEGKSRDEFTKFALGLENVAKRASMIKAAQTLKGIATEPETFDAEPMLVGVRNGTVDLTAGRFRPSKREDYVTKQLGTSYDGQADCPQWRKFLGEVFDNNKDMIGYVQRAVGYSLTGSTREQKMFLLLGEGANGKSTFLETLAKLFGDYAATTPFTSFDADNRNAMGNDVAMLVGTRFVTIIETEEDRRLAEAKVKSVTGGDRITCRLLYQDFFTYVPQFKIWMAMNHLPVIRNNDRGIWRRLQLIEFKRSFEGHEDKDLPERLAQELPGILNWALHGLREYQQLGLQPPLAVERAVANYKKDMDKVGQWIADSCTILQDLKGYDFEILKAWAIANDWYLESAEGYRHYSDYAKSRGEYPVSQTSWGNRLSKMGLAKGRVSIRGQQQTVYLGIRRGQHAKPLNLPMSLQDVELAAIPF